MLTGSAVPADTKEITHSGTGRFTWLTMRPMSLYESGDSTGEVSLKDLFDGTPEIDGNSNPSIDRLAFLICRGGWPQAADMRDEIALDQAMDYYDAVVHLRNGKCGLIEIKRGGDKLIEEGAPHAGMNPRPPHGNYPNAKKSADCPLKIFPAEKLKNLFKTIC